MVAQSGLYNMYSSAGSYTPASDPTMNFQPGEGATYQDPNAPVNYTNSVGYLGQYAPVSNAPAPGTFTFGGKYGMYYQNFPSSDIPADVAAAYPGIKSVREAQVGQPAYNPASGVVGIKPPPTKSGGFFSDLGSLATSWAKDFGPVLGAAALGGMIPPGTSTGVEGLMSSAGATGGVEAATAMTPYTLAGGSTVGAGVDATMGLGDLSSLMSTSLPLSAPAAASSSLYPGMAAIGASTLGGAGSTLASAGGGAVTAGQELFQGTAAAPVYDAVPTLTGNTASAGGFLGAAKDLGGAVMDTLGGAGGLGGLGKDLTAGVGGLLDLYTGVKGISGDSLTKAASAADPFAGQRGQYQGMLQSLMTDPSKISLTPGAQFQMQQGTENLTRADAAKGFLGSGNILGDLLKYSQGVASEDYWKQLEELNLLSGASMGSPAASGSILAGMFNQKQEGASSIASGAGGLLGAVTDLFGGFF